MSDALAASAVPWAREFTLAVGEVARFRVGPLGILVQRRSDEWRAVWEMDPDTSRMDIEAACPVAGIRSSSARGGHRSTGRRCRSPIPCGERLALALDHDPVEVAALRAAGWRVIDAREPAAARSLAEALGVNMIDDFGEEA